MTRTTAEISADIEAIEAKISAHARNTNEGDRDMPTQWDRQRAALSKEFRAACVAEANDEWSLENTKARRAAMNAEISKIAAKRKPVWSDMAAIQDRLGFRGQDLKAAIAQHGL